MTSSSFPKLSYVWKCWQTHKSHLRPERVKGLLSRPNLIPDAYLKRQASQGLWDTQRQAHDCSQCSEETSRLFMGKSFNGTQSFSNMYLSKEETDTPDLHWNDFSSRL